MKKVLVLILLLAGLCFLGINNVIGQTTTSLSTSTSLPIGGLGVTVSEITANPPYNGTTDVWSTTVPTIMDFGTTLVELTDTTGKKLGVFGPSNHHYYALDFGIGGGGAPTTAIPTISFSFTGETPSVTSSIFDRMSASYVLLTYNTADPTKPVEGTPTIQLLKAAPSLVLSDPASFSGGHWVRVYIGIITNPAIVTGADTPSLADHIFTYSTPPGTYSGTLNINIGI